MHQRILRFFWFLIGGGLLVAATPIALAILVSFAGGGLGAVADLFGGSYGWEASAKALATDLAVAGGLVFKAITSFGVLFNLGTIWASAHLGCVAGQSVARGLRALRARKTDEADADVADADEADADEADADVAPEAALKGKQPEPGTSAKVDLAIAAVRSFVSDITDADEPTLSLKQVNYILDLEEPASWLATVRRLLEANEDKILTAGQRIRPTKLWFDASVDPETPHQARRAGMPQGIANRIWWARQVIEILANRHR